MSPHHRAWLGLACGSAGLGLATVYTVMAIRAGTVFPVPALELESLIAFVLLALAFQYALPLLIWISTWCWTTTPHLWITRLGFGFALAALLAYLVFLFACYRTLTAT